MLPDEKERGHKISPLTEEKRSTRDHERKERQDQSHKEQHRHDSQDKDKKKNDK
jgi:hypothetical protein